MHWESLDIFLGHLGACSSVHCCHKNLQFQDFLPLMDKNQTFLTCWVSILFSFNPVSTVFFLCKRLAELSLSLLLSALGSQSQKQDPLPPNLPVLPHSLRLFPQGDMLITGHIQIWSRVLKHFTIFFSLSILDICDCMKKHLRFRSDSF